VDTIRVMILSCLRVEEGATRLREACRVACRVACWAAMKGRCPGQIRSALLPMRGSWTLASLVTGRRAGVLGVAALLAGRSMAWPVSMLSLPTVTGATSEKLVPMPRLSSRAAGSPMKAGSDRSGALARAAVVSVPLARARLAAPTMKVEILMSLFTAQLH